MGFYKVLKSLEVEKRCFYCGKITAVTGELYGEDICRTCRMIRRGLEILDSGKIE